MLSEREKYYDEVIAPKLMEVAKLCEEHGLGMACQVEWEPGETGSTIALPKGSSFNIRLVEAAMRCRGNLDTLMIACAKHARMHGHSTLALAQMGVPTTPEKPGTDAV